MCAYSQAIGMDVDKEDDYYQYSSFTRGYVCGSYSRKEQGCAWRLMCRACKERRQFECSYVASRGTIIGYDPRVAGTAVDEWCDAHNYQHKYEREPRSCFAVFAAAVPGDWKGVLASNAMTAARKKK